MSYIIMMLEIV